MMNNPSWEIPSRQMGDSKLLYIYKQNDLKEVNVKKGKQKT